MGFLEQALLEGCLPSNRDVMAMEGSTSFTILGEGGA